MLVFLHVSVCSLLVPCMLKSIALCVRVKKLYNTKVLNVFFLLTFQQTDPQPGPDLTDARP